MDIPTRYTKRLAGLLGCLQAILSTSFPQLSSKLSLNLLYV